MFKKRQTLNNQKKVNLENEISQIKNDTTSTAQQQDTLLYAINKPQLKEGRNQSFQQKKLRSKMLQIDGQACEKSGNRIVMHQMEQQVQTKDALNRYFTMIKTQYIQQNPNELRQQQFSKDEQIFGYGSTGDQYITGQQAAEQPKIKSFMSNKMGTIIIQDEDPADMNGQLVEVKQDFSDGNSEQMSQDSINFQQQFIRKTLTTRNYRSIQQQNQSMGKPMESKNSKHAKLRKMLERVNQSGVKKLLTVHAIRKKSERDNLNNELRYLDARISNKQKDLQRKKQTKDELNQRLNKASKILQYLYFFGDRVNRDLQGNLSRQQILKVALVQLPKYQKPQKQLNMQEQKMQCQIISDDQGDEDVYMF